MAINYDDLEDWALRAVQEMQEVCDDAQISKGKPFAEDEHPDMRALMREHERIMAGMPTWQAQIELGKQQRPHAAMKEKS